MSMNDPQEQLRLARETVARRTGGRYQWTDSGWRMARDEVGPTGGLRRAGSFVTRQEWESLERDVAALAEEFAADFPEGEDAGGAAGSPGDVLTTREAADLLQISPSAVAYHARRGDLPARMQGGAWQLRREDVDTYAEQRREQRETEGQEQQGRRGGRDRLDIAGVLASGGALVQSGVAAAGRTAQVIAGFVTGTVASALEMAAGATGAGVARVGDAVANLFTGAIRSGGQLVQSVGTAVTQLFTGALQLAGAAGAVVLGGAIVGLFAGAIVTIGAGLANAVSDALGAVAESAQRALSGVVTVLQDLTRAGREASRQTFGMRALGGMQPGTDLSMMLFGQAMGADVGGMFSSWQSRPEFQRARFGAFGMGYNAADPIGSMQGAAGMLRGVDPMLQYPMASALSGGHPDALMRMAAMDPGQVDKSADLAREFGKNTDLMQRIFGTLEPTLNRIGALMTGLKLEVLEKSIPVIEWATAGLFNLWDSNKETVFGWIEQIPALLRNLTVGALNVGASILEWLARIWPSIEALGQWVRQTVAPTVAGAMDAMGIPVPGGTPRYAPGSPEAETYNASRRRTETVGNVAGWIGEHPIETAAIGLLGPELLRRGAMAGGGAAWRGIGGLFGGGGAAGAEGGAAAAGTGWLGTAGRVLGTAGRWLAGGAAGTAGVIGAGIAGGVALPYYALGMGGALGDVREGAQATGFEDNRGFFGRAWDGIRGTFGASTAESRWIEQQAGMAFDPNAPRGPGVPPRRVEGSVPDRLQDTAAYLRQLAESVKQGSLEANKEIEQQRAARGEDKATLYIQPSAEFAARMEFLQAQAQFRALQVAMA